MTKVIKTILDADSAVTNDLADGADSIMPLMLEQGAPAPYITYRGGIGDPNTTQDGQKMDDWEVSVFIVSKYLYDEGSNSGAETIADNVRASLHNASGTYDGKLVAWIRFNDQGDPETYGTTADQRTQIEQTYTVSIKR